MKKKTTITFFLLLCFAGICLAEGLNVRKSQVSLMQGVEAYLNEDYATAGRCLLQALEENPDNDAAHYYLGFVSAINKDPEGTLKHFEAAYRLDSANVWYAKRLAAAYAMEMSIDDARKMYESILDKRPTDSEVLSSMIDLCVLVDDYAKADSLLTNIEQLCGPSDYSILSRLEILRLQGNFKEFFAGMRDYFRDVQVPAGEKTKIMDRLLSSSEPHFNLSHLKDYDMLVEACLETHPSDTTAIHYAGSYYYSSDRPDKVLELYRTYRSDPRISFLTICVYFERDGFKPALECCKRLEPIVSSDRQMLVELYNMEANCYQNLGETGKTIKAYESALGLDPDNLIALNNYAYFLACLGRNLAKCEEMSKKVIDAEPENATYLDTYAWILYKQKRYDDAVAIFKKVMIYGGRESAEVLEHYAATLEALGKTDSAEGYRQQAKLKRNESEK